MKTSAVIVTCPGRERFLEEAIESLRAQGVAPRVICDDRPSWEKWRQAIEECETEYLALPHDDDVYMPGFIEETTAWLDAHPNAAAVFTLDYLTDENGRRTGQTPLRITPKDEYGFKDIFIGTLQTGNVLRCETVVLRTSVAKAVPYPDRSECGSAHDTQYWFMLLENHTVGIIPKPLVKYREWGGSDTRKNIVGSVARYDHALAMQWAADRRPDMVPWWGRVALGRWKDERDNAVEEARLREKAAKAGTVTFLVCHERPDNAGTGVLVAERVREFNRRDDGGVAYYVYPKESPGSDDWWQSGVPVLRCNGTLEGLSALMLQHRVSRVEFHHLLGWRPEVLTAGTCEKTLFLHDSFLWCLKYHSFDGEKVCNDPGPEKCAACAPYLGLNAEGVSARFRQLRELVKNVKVVANSEYTKIHAERHLGVPVDVHEFAVPPLRPRTRGKKVGYFGGFYPVKGDRVLLEAARLLPCYQFVLFCHLPEGMGGGHSLFGYENVVCCGPYRRQDLPKLVNLVDMAVVPSFNESYGLVYRELKSLGVPVVATKTGGMDGTVPPGDAKALAEAIKEVME